MGRSLTSYGFRDQDYINVILMGMNLATSMTWL